MGIINYSPIPTNAWYLTTYMLIFLEHPLELSELNNDVYKIAWNIFEMNNGLQMKNYSITRMNEEQSK